MSEPIKLRVTEVGAGYQGVDYARGDEITLPEGVKHIPAELVNKVMVLDGEVSNQPPAEQFNPMASAEESKRQEETAREKVFLTCVEKSGWKPDSGAKPDVRDLNKFVPEHFAVFTAAERDTLWEKLGPDLEG